MPSTRALRFALALVPALALAACTSSDADKPEAKTEDAKPTAKAAEPETDPTVKPEAKVSPDLQDPFKKDGPSGVNPDLEDPFKKDGGKQPSADLEDPFKKDAKDGGDTKAEPAAAEGGKKPSPDLVDPFKK